MIAESDRKSTIMSAENTFEACRMCRKPATHVPLNSLFAGNGEKAEIFMLVAETDVSRNCVEIVTTSINFPLIVYCRYQKTKINMML